MRLSNETSVRFVKRAKKSVVLAIVATGTLLASVASNSALADVGGHLQVEGSKTATPKGKNGTKQGVSGAYFDVGGHLMVENTGNVTPKGKKRAKNAERRRQRQRRQERKKARLLDEIEMALDLEEFELADELLDELEDLQNSRMKGDGSVNISDPTYTLRRE